MCALRRVGEAGMHTWYTTSVVVYTRFWCMVVMMFSVLLKRKKCRCNFSSQFCVHIDVELFMHAFMHLCLVQLWILGGGEKTGESIIFCIHCGSLIWVRTIPVKVGIGFDWYNPHSIFFDILMAKITLKCEVQKFWLYYN